MLIKRPGLLQKLESSLKRSRITALLGPRQCGKTTLARQIAGRHASTYFDLENPLDLARLENAQMVLSSLKGLVIIDEIQRKAGLFPLLRVLSDRRPLPARFLILGSASPELVRHSSESLAGRIEFVDMGGLSLHETGPQHQMRLWQRGGFPNSFLARTGRDSAAWRENFIRTFLERDLPQLGYSLPAATMRRFWTMAAHYHGQIWNSSEIGNSLGMAHTTARHYLDLLSGTFLVRQLAPWFENLGKRVVKSQKVYIRDSGLLHSLLRIGSQKELEQHPKYGSSWEGFALEQVLAVLGERDAYFWATHSGAELDLLLLRKGKRWGFEFKCVDAPSVTKSMKIAVKDLKLGKLWVIYPGDHRYPLEEKIECMGLKDISTIL